MGCSVLQLSWQWGGVGEEKNGRRKDKEGPSSSSFSFTVTVRNNLYLNINQLDALNFIISLFQASTCFEHMCSSSGGQNCIIQSLASSH